MQAALALEHAHENGLIHRDVKPGNILVTPDGAAKVSDLGLAGFTDNAEEDPRAGKIVGTADYLAPEQIQSPLDVSAVSDIYSLGCTLYYAITGKVPYPGGTPKTKARRHLYETPWHPRNFAEEISDDFVDLIADMMEKDPAKRIQTMADVAARLEPWASDSDPIPSQQLSRSPWMSPPLPTGAADELEINLKDTGSATFDAADFVMVEGDSASQVSQGTSPATSESQETRNLTKEPPPPPIVFEEEAQQVASTSSMTLLALGLAIAVPISLLIGGFVGFILGMILFR